MPRPVRYLSDRFYRRELHFYFSQTNVGYRGDFFRPGQIIVAGGNACV